MGMLARRRERRAARALPGPVLRCLPPLGSEHPIAHNGLEIRGYAVGPVPILQVLLDANQSRLVLPLGTPSPEALREFPGVPAAKNAGFEGSLDTSAWKPGVHPISIMVVDEQGGSAAWRGEVEVLPFEPPMTEQIAEGIRAGLTMVALESPTSSQLFAGHEYFEVRGWAHCGAGIREVVVTIDDRLRFSANHALHRPDLAAEPAGVDLSRSGFALRIDPRVLDPGEHAITVVAIGEGGASPVGVSRPFVVGGPGAGTDGKPAEPEPAPSLAEAQLAINPPGGGDALTPEAIVDGRFIPDVHAGRLIDAEHQGRYRWAAPAAAGQRVLDAGCGVGYGTAIIAAAGATLAVGVDIEASAVLQARERHGDVAEFEVGDLHELPFDDASFDLAVCFEAIEHVSDPERALDELRRVLTPEGVLLISSPNRDVHPRGNRWHAYAPDELVLTLERRFAHVRPHRQRSHLATMLSDDDRFRAGDPETEVETSVRKLAGSTPGEELHTLAVAGGGELPELDPIVILADHGFDVGAWQRLVSAWQARAAWAESEAAASRAEAGFAKIEKSVALEELESASAAKRILDDVLASWSWRVTRPLRGLKRLLGR